MIAVLAGLAAPLLGAEGAAEACTRCSRFDFLCCDVPSDGRFYLTEFTGGGMACGGTADGGWYYTTSWVRWSCGAKLEVRNPSNGACVVVEVADAGPAAWVEESAGMPILDASPLVCRDLFGSSSCGWSDRLVVEVTEVPEDRPTGPGGCGPAAPPLDAELVGASADAEGDGAGGYRVCAGDAVALTIELRNLGSAVWTDVGDTSPEAHGRAVHLGVPVGEVDLLTGLDWVSVAESTNPEVRSALTSPAGRDCAEEPGCERTRFVLDGRAPAEPGTHLSSWQLVDEGRGWFGPVAELSFRVEACGGSDDPPEEGEPGDDPPEEGEPGDLPPEGGEPGDDPPEEGEPGGQPPGEERGGSTSGLLPGMAGGCGATPAPAGPTGPAPAALAALLLGLLRRGRGTDRGRPPRR